MKSRFNPQTHIVRQCGFANNLDHNGRYVLRKLVNMSPSTLRELIYVYHPVEYHSREQVRRLYKERGDLVETVFNLWLDRMWSPQEDREQYINANKS